uniref:Uncharacterized protein n=1 Tax=Lepeophtheirus salmonis TaxID=72036 RepID=A0A0K2TI05_LEPSM
MGQYVCQLHCGNLSQVSNSHGGCDRGWRVPY